jgi:hypothetical protein
MRHDGTSGSIAHWDGQGPRMKLFECQHCSQALYFENATCESCGRRLGYLPEAETITALEPDGDGWRALARPGTRYRFCANWTYDVCNWLVRAGEEEYCAACRHNRMIPDLSIPDNQPRWRKIETAKHRLFYTLLRLRLPLAIRNEDPDGLAFDFLANPDGPWHMVQPVMTGHDSGLITINLSEADDAERERMRSQMGEPYRTLLGHFRHEIAHYYWDKLVFRTHNLDAFRRVFGNEQEDYGSALQRHYSQGAPADWPQQFVTAYASAHPWEDFAETWAHYFHMVDTLETANSFGMRLRPKVRKGAELGTDIDFDPHRADLDRLIEAWLPLTFAVNSINRSMGQPDLYPFVLSPTVVAKVDFIHGLIHAGHVRPAQRSSKNVLRAMVATLKRKVWLPDPAG